jgi:hypothetical protein
MTTLLKQEGKTGWWFEEIGTGKLRNKDGLAGLLLMLAGRTPN